MKDLTISGKTRKEIIELYQKCLEESKFMVLGSCVHCGCTKYNPFNHHGTCLVLRMAKMKDAITRGDEKWI